MDAAFLLIAEPMPWWEDAGIATWFLAIVGLGGTIAALCTLRTIRQQTDAIKMQVTEMRTAREQTDKLIFEATEQSIAAKRSTEALINAERAWIHVELVRKSHERLLYDLGIVNYGKTPSEIVGWQIGADCLPHGTRYNPDAVGESLKKNVSVFLPTRATKVLDHFDMSQYFSDWDGVVCGRQEGILRIIITYFDTVSGLKQLLRRERQTSVVYRYNTTQREMERLTQYSIYA